VFCAQNILYYANVTEHHTNSCYAHNSECVNIFGRTVCGHRAEGFMVVVKKFTVLRDVCNLNNLYLSCGNRNKIECLTADGDKQWDLQKWNYFLSGTVSERLVFSCPHRKRQTRHLDTVSATVLVQLWHKMTILPFVLHSLKLRIYGPFCQNLKAFHTFCNSESSLFLEKLLLCCLVRFPTFFCAPSREQFPL